jgi:hypothetical protein
MCYRFSPGINGGGFGSLGYLAAAHRDHLKNLAQELFEMK